MTNLSGYVMMATILGLIGGIFYRLYRVSIATMYPEGATGFQGFIMGCMIISLVFGLIYPLKSLKKVFWLAGTIIFLLWCGLIIFSGLTFTFDERSDEYVLYFTEVQTAFLIYLVALGLFTRHAISFSSISGQKLLHLLNGWLVGVVVALLLNYLVLFEIIHLWIIVSCLVLGLIITSRMKIVE